MTVLTTRRIDRRRLARRLAAAGFTPQTGTGSLRVTPAVEVAAGDPANLPADVRTRAARLLGVPPREVLTCSGAFDADRATIVAVAQAVAADAPIAVLDDGAATTYLVHPRDGLIGPEVYRHHPPDRSAMAMLRRALGVTPD